MSDTPRTDMHQNLSRGLMNPAGQAWEFARTLERQMVKARADTRKATQDAIREMRDDRIKRANAVWDNPIGHSAALYDLQRLLKLEASIIDDVIDKLEGEE